MTSERAWVTLVSLAAVFAVLSMCAWIVLVALKAWRNPRLFAQLRVWVTVNMVLALLLSAAANFLIATIDHDTVLRWLNWFAAAAALGVAIHNINRAFPKSRP